MSITYDQAIALVKAKLEEQDRNTYYSNEYDGCDIMPECTEERKNGWLFSTQSKKFIESQKHLDTNGIDTLTWEDGHKHQLLGGGPIYVTRAWILHELSSLEWEDELKILES